MDPVEELGHFDGISCDFLEVRSRICVLATNYANLDGLTLVVELEIRRARVASAGRVFFSWVGAKLSWLEVCDAIRVWQDLEARSLHLICSVLLIVLALALVFSQYVLLSQESPTRESYFLPNLDPILILPRKAHYVCAAETAFRELELDWRWNPQDGQTATLLSFSPIRTFRARINC